MTNLNLLEESLPELSLRPDVSPAEFFDRCESIGRAKGYRIDRRREYMGPGFDHLNLYLVETATDAIMVRMVSKPTSNGRLSVDVVAHGKFRTREYDEYMVAAKVAYEQLLSDYAAVHGKRLRIGIPRRPPRLDRSAVNCLQIEYARSQFRSAVRYLTVGAGDARERLRSAYSTIHVVRPEDLPSPLDTHLAWVYTQMTLRPARYEWETTLDVTLGKMRRATAGKIAERILAITDALDELHDWCQRQKRET